MNPADPTATTDASPETLAALNRQFTQALLALAEAGQADAACRLAASGWSVLRHQHPREAERLNGVMHALTRTTHPVTTTATGGTHGSKT